MKRILLISLVAALVLSLWGCKMPASSETQPTQTETTPTDTVPTNPEVPVPQKPMIAVALPIVTESVTAEDGTLIFCKTYQNISLTLPENEIADKIILDFLNRTDIEEESEDILEAARQQHSDGVSSLPLWAKIQYKPMRVDQSIISLYGSYSTYTGGAHGASICKSVTYDLVTGKPLSLGAILAEDATADKLLPGILAALAPMHNEGELFEGYEATVSQLLQKDLATYSDWYLSKTGLCFYYSPYEIGPYASGDIVAEIPYSDLTGILRDDYFPVEKDAANGTIISQEFESADLGAYTQIAELILDENGEKTLFFTDSIVQDIRISTQAPFFANPSYTESYEIFGAEALTPGDAIVIAAPKGSTLTITYTTGGEEITETYELAKD